MKILRQGLTLFTAFLLVMTAMLAVPGNPRISAAEGYRTIEVEIPNAGFEEGTAGKWSDIQIPGWKPLWEPYAEAYYEVTTQRAYSGKQSVKFTDTSTSKGAVIHSASLPVIPGKEYTASAMMFLEEPTVAASLMMRFFDESGKQVGTDALFHYRTPKNEWFKAEVKGVAPANAKYALVYASLSNFFTAVAYYDDFKLTYEQKDMSLALKAPATAVKGKTATVKITATDALNLYAADLSLTYDQAALKVASVELDPAFKDGKEAFLTWKDQDGKLRMIASHLQNHSVSGNKDMLVITFEVLASGGSTNLAIQRGSVLAPESAKTGQDVFTLPADIKARITITDSSEDLNHDGVVNLVDLLLIGKKVDQKPEGAIQHYDLNGDGKIDVTDVALVALKVSKN